MSEDRKQKEQEIRLFVEKELIAILKSAEPSGICAFESPVDLERAQKTFWGTVYVGFLSIHLEQYKDNYNWMFKDRQSGILNLELSFFSLTNLIKQLYRDICNFTDNDSERTHIAGLVAKFAHDKIWSNYFSNSITQ